MEIFKGIMTALEVLASLALIVVVLLQTGKEAGLSSALSGKTETYLGKNKKESRDKKLASATKWVGLVWILLTLVLCLLH